MGSVGVILAAAGSGTRMKSHKNKVLMSLLGEPVLIRSVRKFVSWADQVVVVVRRQDYDEIERLLKQWDLTVSALVIGGDTRQDSVRMGIAALKDIDWVFIHDAARPLIEPEIILKAYHEVKKYKAVGVAIPVKDTIKMVDSNLTVVDTPDRKILWAVQTPQAFSFSLIKQAYQEALKNGWEGTDDLSIVEKTGVKAKLIQGNDTNIKITTPEDLQLAEVFMRKQAGGKQQLRSGIGYDVHRLEKGQPLILGGVRINYCYGLTGHSDADVAVHSLMDSLLGAAGLGDIGKHFPDTDPKYRGISSIVLLREVIAKINGQGYHVSNVDITIVAQKPKLASYIDTMRDNLAKAMAIECDKINIKATTTEELGFCGREEGIAAYAIATIYRL